MKTHLPLNIKILLIVFGLLSGINYAQEEKPESDNSSEKDDFFMVAQLGMGYGVAVGNNFARESGSIGGMELTVQSNLFASNFMIGGQLEIMGSSPIENKTLTGNYNRFRTVALGVHAGYQHLFTHKLKWYNGIGIGYVEYKNRGQSGIKFIDDGTALWANTRLSYKLAKFFGLYFSTGLRTDFLTIEAPAPIQDFFNNATYLRFGLGFRFVF